MKPFEDDYEEAHCEACERLRKTESGEVCEHHRSQKSIVYSTAMLRRIHRAIAEAKARREEQEEMERATEEDRNFKAFATIGNNRTKRT